MGSEITETEARLALDSIEGRRRQVIAEIDVPSWYWVGLAAGWVGIGALANWDPRGPSSSAPWPSGLPTRPFRHECSPVATARAN